MIMTSQFITPPINPSFQATTKINKIGYGINCNGTYLNSGDYYIEYIIKSKTVKEEIIAMAKNEVFFDDEDKKSAYREIKRLSVEKQKNIFDYYD